MIWLYFMITVHQKPNKPICFDVQPENISLKLRDMKKFQMLIYQKSAIALFGHGFYYNKVLCFNNGFSNCSKLMHAE